MIYYLSLMVAGLGALVTVFVVCLIVVILFGPE
jgi:hypothetical protein